MSFLNVLLDVGYDYGAIGGPDDFGTEIVPVADVVYANQRRQHALGEWELGSRNIIRQKLDLLQNFWMSMRGTAYAFRYLDWNDFTVSQQALVIDGTAETQLTKTYGGFGNDYITEIFLPVASTVVLEIQDGGAGPWVEQEVDTDYELDDATGIVTWLATPPAAPDAVRWTGDFHKRVRFTVTRFRAPFLAYERFEGGVVHAVHALSALTVREERPPAE